jgi:enoyl-CoA hydratase/carnithine racemase
VTDVTLLQNASLDYTLPYSASQVQLSCLPTLQNETPKSNLRIV